MSTATKFVIARRTKSSDEPVVWMMSPYRFDPVFTANVDQAHKYAKRETAERWLYCAGYGATIEEVEA